MEVVVQNHDPWWNPQEEITRGEIWGTWWPRASYEACADTLHCFFLCRWTSSRFSFANVTHVLILYVHTTFELTYHWVSLSQFLSENAAERARQTCLHDNQEHRTIYVLHSSPFSLAVTWWTTVGNNVGKINFQSLLSKAHISQQDTLIRFRIINYWNREHIFDLSCISVAIMTADRSGREGWGMNCLRPLKYWGRRFESHTRHGCVCTFIQCLCCSVRR
jgi:hypothetical protein